MSQQELSFEDFYRLRYRETLTFIKFRLKCDSYTAEDIQSDAFLLLRQKWDEIEPKTEKVLTLWMHRTLSFMIMAARRKENQQAKILPIEVLDEAEQGMMPSTDSEYAEQEHYLELLKKIKARLSDEDWLFFTYMKARKKSDDIVRRFGIRKGEYYARRRRIKDIVRKIQDEEKK